MPEQPLQCQRVYAGLQQMRCKAVTQTMYSTTVGQSYPFHRSVEGVLHTVRGNGAVRIEFAWKHPILWR